MSVYRNYTQAELDAQYNNSPQAPGGDPAVYFAEYRERSRRARERFHARLDVPYGSSERERLDVFPAEPGAPTWIFIHGGFWRRLDKSDFSFLAG
ncbi:MAG: alpha/beta hydrolase, partial [Candidatus Eremiobacteraeota bacterium]|nr:alpha/beta hydrolase [Candidatus Eremiobacteraeota bacterium]